MPLPAPAGTLEDWAWRHVRLGGVLYLLNIALGLFGEALVRGSLVGPGDPAATAAAIAAAPLLWRAGIAGDLLMQLIDLPLILIFYGLLRSVNRPLALLATLFNLVQTAALALNKLTLLLPLWLLDGGAASAGLPAAQQQALAFLAIQAHGHGFGIGLIFFGMACLIRGQLLARSPDFPAWLGRLLQLAGAAYLLNSFALLLAPDFARLLFPAVLAPSFVGELVLALWLLLFARRKASAAGRALG